MIGKVQLPVVTTPSALETVLLTSCFGFYSDILSCESLYMCMSLNQVQSIKFTRRTIIVQQHFTDDRQKSLNTYVNSTFYFILTNISKILF